MALPGPLCHHAESHPSSAANGRTRARQWAGDCPCTGDGGRAVEDAVPYKFTVSCTDIDNETLYEQTMRRRALAEILPRACDPGRGGLRPDLGIHRHEPRQMDGGPILRGIVSGHAHANAPGEIQKGLASPFWSFQ